MGRILITGANGYIGTRLLPVLAEEGHHVIALVRSVNRLVVPSHLKANVTVQVADMLDRESLQAIPKEVDAAYYLVHSMKEHAKGFASDEERSAFNFKEAISQTDCKQVVYLSGLAQGDQHSEHMVSRHRVEEVLREGKPPVTVLRAGIVIGSGSASFEIIRDLVEKLPVMIAPCWVRSRCQPIAVADVLFYLKSVLGNEQCYGSTFEIGGPDVLTYNQMLLELAKLRGLKRFIIPVPVLTPKLSSYWLFFVTTTNFTIARALVDSLKTDAVCSEFSIRKVIPHECLTYEEAVKRAFDTIEQSTVAKGKP